jgi:dTDP-4-dehydrorhamnose reductase
MGLPVRVSADRILPTTAAQYPAVAPRPYNSRLNTTKLRQTFGISLPNWEDGVRAVVAELARQSDLLRGVPK